MISPKTRVIFPSPCVPATLTVPKMLVTVAHGLNEPIKTSPPPTAITMGPALLAAGFGRH
jgi:hypothetical protein